VLGGRPFVRISGHSSTGSVATLMNEL
jgi:hypothetical protein